MKELVSNLKFVWKYAREEKKYFIILIFGYLIKIVSGIVLPILSAKIMIGLTSNNYVQILGVGFIIFMTYVICNINNALVYKLTSKMYRNIMTRLEIDIGKNVLRVCNDCLDKKGNGVFIQRMTNDTSMIASIFNNLISSLSNFIEYIGVLIAIFIVNKLIFIYVILSAVVLYLLENERTRKRKEDNKIYRKALDGVSSFVGELVRGARDIKMLNSEEDFVSELSLRIDDTNYKHYVMQKRSLNYKLAMWNITSLGNFILIILLVLMMERGIIVASIALVLYNYARSVSNSAYYVGDFLEQIKDFNLSSERILSIINGDEFKKEVFGDVHLGKVNGDFEFRNVSFGYDSKKVLNKLNFKIKANETVAFVGKSGAGKTTIFNLLCKMYDDYSGDILIDGVDIRRLDKDSIRGNITIISQSPYIFNMSIRDNLRLVKRNLSDKEMKEACKLAALDGFIQSLPDKYDTIIGEGGVNLSGGQKQRLAIARALVQKTEIILFDEATSALDNETQLKIQEAINNMKNEYTILIIAHRLSTIINADRILFLDKGKIICEGNHSYLLENCDEYRKLYESEIRNRK